MVQFRSSWCLRARRTLIDQTRVFLIAFVYAFAIGKDAWADGKPDLISIVKTRHRAASELIRSLAARFKYESLQPNAEVVCSGEYRRSLDTVQIHEGIDGQWTSDVMLKNGETRVVGKHWASPREIVYRAERAAGTQMIGLSDMWMGMLMVVVGPNGEPMPIDRLLDCAKRPPSASRVTEDGSMCVRVKMEYDAADGREVQLTIWHDINRNYLVRKRTVAIKGADWRTVSTVTEFAEPVAGIFVPSKCRGQTFAQSKLIREWLITMSDTSVNSEIPLDALQLPTFPNGTVLHDRINETKYRIDSNWNQIGPASPDRRLKVAGPSLGQSEFTSQSRSEPASSPRWLLSLSLALLVAVAIYLVFRMGRRNTRSE